MNEEQSPPEQNDPDTSTDEGQDLELESQPMGDPFAEAIPTAPAAGDAPPPPQEVRVMPPRTFPQHYSLMFSALAIFLGCLTVWEREHVFGARISGHETISGSLLMLLSGYTILIGVLNVLQGRLRGMAPAFLGGVLAIYFGAKALIRTTSREALDIMGQKVGGFTAYGEITGATFQEKIANWIGQFGPGVILTLLGGLIVLGVFVKAMMSAKPAEAPPAARPSGRRRR